MWMVATFLVSVSTLGHYSTNIYLFSLSVWYNYSVNAAHSSAALYRWLRPCVISLLAAASTTSAAMLFYAISVALNG